MVEEFLYLDALLDNEGEATKDLQQRLSKAKNKMATDHLTPTNPGDHWSEQYK